MNGSELLASLVRQVRQSILACLANTSTTCVDNVVLAGKASKMRGVSEMLQDLFGAHKVLDSIDPEQVTALGAALQARHLCGLVNYFGNFDVLQVALGVKTAECITTIFPKNTVFPARKELWFRARFANNKVVVIEGEHASTCRKLYSLVVQSTQGLDEHMLVRIVFELSAQQKLSVAIYQSWSDSETTFVCDLSLGDDQESPDLEPVQLVDDQESPDLEPVQLVDIPLLQAQQRQTNKKASKLVEEVVD
jgi:molecular chaperone DnaK (HSP70)